MLKSRVAPNARKVFREIPHCLPLFRTNASRVCGLASGYLYEHPEARFRVLCRSAYSDDVKEHSDDVNKVGAKRHWHLR
jgi:hypothetical protein